LKREQKLRSLVSKKEGPIEMLRDTERILLIEDDQNDILLLRRVLNREGFGGRVQFVCNGQDGIDYLQGKAAYADRDRYPFPSFIITDLKMPRVDGFQVLQWLRDHPERAVIPTIVLSSSAQEEDVIRAYQLGANSYFLKPLDSCNLQKLVKEICRYWEICRRPSVKNC
jgi:CheY-like chemotaxis protein